jgi:hypothetical protein
MPLEPRLLRAFLSPRDRVVVANLARAGKFAAGRQATGYEKANLLDVIMADRLVKRCLRELEDPALYDAWLLRYPVGSEIPVHTDPPIDGMCHVRINALALASKGGVLYVDGLELPLDGGDAYLFRPDAMKHMVTAVEENERLVLSVGANVDVEHAKKLGLA